MKYKKQWVILDRVILDRAPEEVICTQSPTRP